MSPDTWIEKQAFKFRILKGSQIRICTTTPWGEFYHHTLHTRKLRLRAARKLAKDHRASYEVAKPRCDSRVCSFPKSWLTARGQGTTGRDPKQGRGQSCGKSKVSSTWKLLGVREGPGRWGWTRLHLELCFSPWEAPGWSGKGIKLASQTDHASTSAPPFPSQVTLGNVFTVSEFQWLQCSSSAFGD